MSIISLFKSGFFPDVISFRQPVLSVVALVFLVGCGLIQWRLCNDPAKEEHRFRQYYPAFALIAGIIIVDIAELFFKGTDTQFIRNAFGCLVLGIIGMAVSAGVWYLGMKKSRSGNGSGSGQDE